MDKEQETVSALALNRIFGYEPKISKLLIDRLGSAGAIFTKSKDEIELIFGPYSKKSPEITSEALDRAAEELQRLRAQGCDFISITDDAYPALLKECEDPPAGLYVRSTTAPEAIFPKGPYVSIVGTRDISPYGREWCGRIVRTLAMAPAPPVIVSGFAIGVDINAHLAALDAGLPTIAVLPVGIDDVYPRRHRAIAERLAATPGCALVSDYPPGTTAQAANFLRRNRIIAGMSQGTILVESKMRGGGTMTAGLAASYGRDVFALPGRIDDLRSQGCNRLIAEKIAEPVHSLGTLQETLGLGRFSRIRKTDIAEEVARRLGGKLDGRQTRLLQETALHIKENRGVTPDEICQALGISYQDAAFATGMLESEGIIVTDLLLRCSINAKID